MGAITIDPFPIMVRTLLQLSCITVCGRNIGGDCSRLEKLNIKCKNRIELRGLMQALNPAASTSLSSLSQTLLGMNLEKYLQADNYSQDPLPVPLVRYAALDALVSRRCAEKMLDEIYRKKISHPNQIILPTDELEVGDTVKYIVSRNVVAKGIVSFIGKNGFMQKWGNLTVGKNKALIRLTNIYVPGTKPSHSDGTFDCKTTTIKNIFEAKNPPILAVHTSALLKQLSTNSPTPILPKTSSNNETTRQPLQRELFQSLPATEVIVPVEEEERTEEEDLEGENNPNTFHLNYVDLGMDQDGDGIRSRMKEDVFHQFQDLPYKKKCLIRTLVSRLLIHATYKCTTEDYKEVVSYLQEHKNVIDIDTHFYHNREW